LSPLPRKELLAIYDEELRRRAPYFDAAVRLEFDGPIVRMLGATPDAGNNCVLYSRLDEASAAAAVDRQAAYFERLGRDFEWKLHDHDAPATLRTILRDRGFVPGEGEMIMALDLAEGRVAAEPPPGYEVGPWDDGLGLEDLFAVQAAVYPEEVLGWLEESLVRERAARPESIRFHAVRLSGRPVCIGWMRLHGRFASLFGGSTLKEHRGKGLYRTLLASRLNEARRGGAAYALVDAGPMSRPILARLGFQALTGTTPFVRRLKAAQK
jgi:hypothetical protein